MKFETRAIHSGYSPQGKSGAVLPPVEQSASFAFEDPKDIEDVFKGRQFGHVYSRISNPSVFALEQRLAAMEDGIGAVATASGMAAIHTVVQTLVNAGENIISSRTLFGGTFDYFKQINDENDIAVRFVNSVDPKDFEAQIDDKTRFIFVESIGNPAITIPNYADFSRLAKKYNIPFVVDTTLASPYIIDSKAHGVDIAVYSATKYIAPGGTTIGGVLVDTGNFDWSNSRTTKVAEAKSQYGHFAFIGVARKRSLKNFGACMAPWTAFLLTVGCETVGLRVQRHSDNAQRVAEFLETHPEVVAVRYPGLKNDPYYKEAQTFHKGLGGGLMSVKFGSKEKAYDFVRKTKLAKNSANLGDSRTLAIHMESTIYARHSIEEQEAAGVTDDLVRISIGLEDPEDLIADFEQALRS